MCVRHTAENPHVYMACSQTPRRRDSLLRAAAGWLVSRQKALVQAFGYIAWVWPCLVFELS